MNSYKLYFAIIIFFGLNFLSAQEDVSIPSYTFENECFDTKDLKISCDSVYSYRADKMIKKQLLDNGNQSYEEGIIFYDTEGRQTHTKYIKHVTDSLGTTISLVENDAEKFVDSLVSAMSPPPTADIFKETQPDRRNEITYKNDNKLLVKEINEFIYNKVDISWLENSMKIYVNFMVNDKGEIFNYSETPSGYLGDLKTFVEAKPTTDWTLNNLEPGYKQRFRIPIQIVINE